MVKSTRKSSGNCNKLLRQLLNTGLSWKGSKKADNALKNLLPPPRGSSETGRQRLQDAVRWEMKLNTQNKSSTFRLREVEFLHSGYIQKVRLGAIF